MVEGRALRTDGVHYSPETATWVVKRLLPQLLAAGHFPERVAAPLTR
jgi:hypothetical protein